ncbi:Hypothetical protein CAP_7372 [Chondromyces apiculatus DSM 436]|uniref:Uncharacterized protein n=1 Tax=Chondromyces apiculatus DSM 436 TaxID=1192034 RepID=A0A017T0T6_9BACT|nr:Hypothetical protein CAP_7372 [Chondromyces apiculatus DSM 436]
MLGVGSTACTAPEYGALPALCSEGTCPEGYDCIRGVCAEPGTSVPITVTRVENLRGEDLKLIPQSQGVLVVWQTYAYGPEGQRFRGARVSADGSVGPTMDLVTSFVADEGSVEPFYDVLGVSDEDLLLAVSATRLPEDDSPRARLLTYRVRLPSWGNETRGVQFEAAWPGEERLDTAGYGAVSRPKLLARGDRVELGYVRTREPETEPEAGVIGELGVFLLGLDGAQQAPATFSRVRRGQSVAVGVAGAIAREDAAFWVLDDVRPSAVLFAGGGAPSELRLGALGMAVDATTRTLLYLQPSERGGDKLPTDPVAGEAELRRVDATLSGGDPPFALSDTPVGTLGQVRDTPRPAWVAREGRPALLVSPGASINAPSLQVHTVDPESGVATLVTRIERLSSTNVDATAAVVAGGSLYVAWTDVTESAAVIRMAVLPEP